MVNRARQRICSSCNAYLSRLLVTASGMKPLMKRDMCSLNCLCDRMMIALSTLTCVQEKLAAVHEAPQVAGVAASWSSLNTLSGATEAHLHPHHVQVRICSKRHQDCDCTKVSVEA